MSRWNIKVNFGLMPKLTQDKNCDADEFFLGPKWTVIKLGEEETYLSILFHNRTSSEHIWTQAKTIPEKTINLMKGIFEKK